MRAFVFACSMLSIFSSAMATTCIINRSAPVYKQCNPRWHDKILGLSKTITICEQGSVISSIASALASFGMKINGEVPNPDNLNEFFKENEGFNANLMDWSILEKKFGLTFVRTISVPGAIIDEICANRIVFLYAQTDYESHEVLVTGYDNKKIYVNDPLNDRAFITWEEAQIARIYKI